MKSMVFSSSNDCIPLKIEYRVILRDPVPKNLSFHKKQRFFTSFRMTSPCHSEIFFFDFAPHRRLQLRMIDAKYVHPLWLDECSAISNYPKIA
jgi:hypothetical protein